LKLNIFYYEKLFIVQVILHISPQAKLAKNCCRVIRKLFQILFMHVWYLF